MFYQVGIYQRGGSVLKEATFEHLSQAQEYFNLQIQTKGLGEALILLKEQRSLREEYLLDVLIVENSSQ